MASFTITFAGPEEVIQKGIQKYAEACGWTATIEAEDEEGRTIQKPNPHTVEQCARRGIREHVARTISKLVESAAARAAKRAAHSKVREVFGQVTDG